ncbi:unnamed protein product [Durusdinium trenchii]|uniref:ShKT domain-containing protein n=2 Tax=Durusdinium trenchii TaxID=1381693 RepID=A0ABP0Q533_9DINO
MGECNICWSEIESTEDAATLTCGSSGADEQESWWFWQESCPKVHRACLSKYLMIQAESGYFPATCPFCLRKLSVVELYEHLSKSEKKIWLQQHDGWRELRESGPNGRHPDLEEATLMQDLGCRRCPGCGAWIEKQAGGWLTGCDKMTCRCGCRFCFQCGSVEANCGCSLGHDFLDREMVLSNYTLLDGLSLWPFSLFEPELAEVEAETQALEAMQELSAPTSEGLEGLASAEECFNPTGYTAPADGCQEENGVLAHENECSDAVLWGAFFL